MAVPLGVVGGGAAAEKEKARRPLLRLALLPLLPLPASGEAAGWRRGRRPVARCSLQAWSREWSSSVAVAPLSEVMASVYGWGEPDHCIKRTAQERSHQIPLIPNNGPSSCPPACCRACCRSYSSLAPASHGWARSCGCYANGKDGETRSVPYSIPLSSAVHIHTYIYTHSAPPFLNPLQRNIHTYRLGAPPLGRVGVQALGQELAELGGPWLACFC